MIVGKAIYYLLTNATDVTDIVSTRVYPEIAQQDADLPYIVYAIANNEPTDTKPEPSKLDTAQVEVNIYSDSYTQAIDLAVAVRAALDRVKGTYNGVNVQSIQYLNEVIDFDEPQRAYNINADYDVRISRSGFEIAQGSPITGVQLGELSDVDVTGVTNGQLIAYNEATGNWEAANDAGGAETLDDLTDVDAGAPSSGQLLAYGQDTWETIAQDELTLPIGSVTGLQSELNTIPDGLDDLDDVKIIGTPSEGDALVYQSGFFSLGTAGASTLGDLTDVNTTGAGVGSLIQFNGSTWDISAAELPDDAVYYHNRYASEAETLLDGATDTVELYYTAQADGDGLHEDAQSDTATTGYDIRRKLYYAEKAQADPDTSGDWTQFTAIADNTTYANAKAALLAYLKERTGGTVPISLKMTWEEVAQAPAFTGLLNESYGSGAAAAYSVRRLNGNYTGAAIEVERSSDNTTQDIGFDSNGDLDESALTTFCTGTTCKVRTWYDQATAGGTGSGNDAVQTTHANQPTIYTGGAIVKENGRVAVDFDGTDESFDTSWSAGDTSAFTAFNMASPTNNTTASQLYDLRDANDDGLRLIMFSDSKLFYSASANDLRTTAYVSGQQLVYSNYASSTIATGIDGATTNTSSAPASTSVTANATLFRDGVGDTFYFNGKAQEAIFYGSDKSANRTDIESNIGDYFTQNTPLLDTYTGAAAAYSLRKLRTAYSGSAIRVRRASDNTEQDIGFNVFGELDTTSLASFCSGTNGFVKTWYDQSGNANDATQTTAANQPKIYDSSTGVVTENGKPAVEFDGANDYLTAGTGHDFTTSSFFSVYRNSLDAAQLFGAQGTNDNGWRFQGGTSAARLRVQGVNTDNSGADSGLSRSVLRSATISGGTVSSYVDSTNSATGSATLAATTSFDFRLGTVFAQSLNLTGNCQEFIWYNSDQSDNRSNIEDNINTFYSIY